MTPPAPVGRTAFLLGFAGLLPQVAAVVTVAIARMAAPDSRFAALIMPALSIGLIYPLVILSFLGGMWWGLAMRRERRQGPLVGIAIVPSLAVLALAGFLTATQRFDLTLVAIGSAILLTLPVDHALTRRGDAPENWMQLRIPLSVGLGVLTILLGVLIGGPITRY